MSKVISVSQGGIKFDDGLELFSNHDSDCCESHYLDFEHITLQDFDNLEFDLTGDDFFRRIPDYGIELVPVVGHSVKIPGYGYNNGYYSDHLELVLSGNGTQKTFNITECQVIEG